MMLRKGMWVKYQGHIGIYIPEKQVIVSGGLPVEVVTHEFHMVNEAGETLTVLRMLTTEGMTQAALADIPEPRRPAADVAVRLGYV